MEVKSSGAYSREANLKFALNGLSGSVTNARLRLCVQYASTANHTVYSVTNDSWTESGINWNNKPATVAALDTQAVPGIDQWIEFDVTAFVASQMSDGQVSFTIRSDNSNTVGYHSTEGSDPARQPQLQVTTN